MEKLIRGLGHRLAPFLLLIVVIFNLGSHVIERVHSNAETADSVKVIAVKAKEQAVHQKKVSTNTNQEKNKPERKFLKRDEPVFQLAGYRIWFYPKLYQSGYFALSSLTS